MKSSEERIAELEAENAHLRSLITDQAIPIMISNANALHAIADMLTAGQTSPQAQRAIEEHVREEDGNE